MAVAVTLFLGASRNMWLVAIFPLWVMVLGVLIVLKARTLAQRDRLARSPPFSRPEIHGG